MVVEDLKAIFGRAHREREEIALAVIEDALSKFGSQINRSSKSKLLGLAGQHFPNHSYFTLVSKTEDVFARKNAPKLRLNKNEIDLALSLIDVDARNTGTHTLKIIAQSIDEHQLLNLQNKPSFIKHTLEIASHLLVKWILGIVGFLIVVAITYWIDSVG